MTKADLVELLSKGTGLTKIETEAVVEGFFLTILDCLKNGKGIEIRGFGTYKIKKKNARAARNPRTGERVDVPERYSPVFKFSKEFKDFVDQGLKQKMSREHE